MMNIPNVHFSHTAVPSFIAGPCSRGSLKRLSSQAIKKEKLKIKEGGGCIAVREEKDKGSQTLYIPITFHHCTKHSISESRDYEFNFFSWKGFGMGWTSHWILEIYKRQWAMPLPLPFFSDIWQQWIRPNINHMAAVRMASGMMRRLKLARI